MRLNCSATSNGTIRRPVACFVDLGFANLDLQDPSDAGTKYSLGIIDVPGHADFVKNMVAGVGSIDRGRYHPPQTQYTYWWPELTRPLIATVKAVTLHHCAPFCVTQVAAAAALLHQVCKTKINETGHRTAYCTV